MTAHDGRRTWHRVPAVGPILILDPKAKAYQRDLPDEEAGAHLSVLVTYERLDGNGNLIAHLSISHRIHDAAGDLVPGRYPTWDEQKEACWLFVPGVALASYLPAEGAPYVNHHPTTFHWWQTKDAL